MIYRALTPDDIKRYRKLRIFGLRESPDTCAEDPEHEKQFSLDYYRWRLSQPRSIHITLGAFEKETLAGFGHLTRNRLVKSSHRASIWAIYVRPEFRRRGIGRELVRQLVDGARAMEGVTFVDLNVVSSNLHAKSLYESFGFRPVGEYKQSFKVDSVFYDETFMALQLNGYQESTES